ncbi:hypothetical protein Adt_15009 [Abeliophyllum distichum]|uniref:Uncharacterized protein n=1 Tax=Abeliophyllum distichum TaxID=126358 RepID=A0ABD1U184_9LAMI
MEDRTSPSSFRGGPVLEISIFDSFVNLLDPPSHGIAYGCFPHVRQPPGVTLLAGKETVPAAWKSYGKKQKKGGKRGEETALGGAAGSAPAGVAEAELAALLFRQYGGGGLILSK